MADSSCLVLGVSYASAIPNESKLGNPMRALGESVSFGRYMNEPLSWEKWSTFTHKNYVEEAERYAQPGSVAQKKAFFEAYYKRLAAQKATASLEQENAAKTQAEQAGGTNDGEEEQKIFLNPDSDVKMEEAKDEGPATVVDAEIGKEAENNVVITESEGLMESPVKRRDSVDKAENLDNQDTLSASQTSGSLQMERPLLKQSSVDSENISSAAGKERSDFSSVETSIQQKTWKLQSSSPVEKENNVTQSTRTSSEDSTGRRRSTSKPLGAFLSLVSLNEFDNEPLVTADTRGTPTYSAPAKRKQKPEEKFDNKEGQKIQIHKTFKEKAGNKLRKLSCGLCFIMPQPSRQFYKERETPKIDMKKTLAGQTQSAVLRSIISNKKQGHYLNAATASIMLTREDCFQEFINERRPKQMS